MSNIDYVDTETPWTGATHRHRTMAVIAVIETPVGTHRNGYILRPHALRREAFDVGARNCLRFVHLRL